MLFKTIAQLANLRHARQMNLRQLAGGAHPDNAADIFRTGPPAMRLVAAAQQRAKTRSPPQPEAAHPFGTVEFMRRAGEHIDPRLAERHRDFAHHLHRVAVKQRALLMSQLRQFGHREHDAGFVIGPHDADQRHARAKRRPKLRHIQGALLIHGDTVDQVSLALQLFAHRQGGGMFDHAGDDLAPLRHQGHRRGDGGGGGLGGAGGKDDLAGVVGPEQGGHLLVRPFKGRLRRQTKIVYRRRVAVKVG